MFFSKELAARPWKLMVGSWKINFVLGWPMSRGYVSFLEGSPSKS